MSKTIARRKPKPKDFQAQTQQWEIERVIPYEGNCKQHPQSQIDKIKKAITEFGFDVPIVVDEHGIIIKGHGRREAALQLGLKTVPVIVRDDLTEAQKKAARMSDNRISDAPYDHDVLKAELASLKDLDFDLDLTGFDDFEVAHLLEGMDTDYQPPENQPPGNREQGTEDPEEEQGQGNQEGDSDDCQCPNCGHIWRPEQVRSHPRTNKRRSSRRRQRKAS